MLYKLALLYSPNLFPGFYSDEQIISDFISKYEEAGVEVEVLKSTNFENIEEFNKKISHYSSTQIVCHGYEGGFHFNFLGKNKYTYEEFFNAGVGFDSQILIMNVCYSGEISSFHHFKVRYPGFTIAYSNTLNHVKISTGVFTKMHKSLMKHFSEHDKTNNFKLDEALREKLLDMDSFKSFILSLDMYHSEAYPNEPNTSSYHKGFSYFL